VTVGSAGSRTSFAAWSPPMWPMRLMA